MSKDTIQSVSAATMTTDIEALTNDLARLDALLAKTKSNEEEDMDVAELLKQLESAEGMAGEVETKVDGILAKLDGIIQEMDGQEQAEIESGADAKVDSDAQTKS
ncbi:hypothetical protein C0995_008692 [Termitomyces sp. Mi166|nr:hypothetical protein C0995_008692 [Termitomyces sp. Mi166\